MRLAPTQHSIQSDTKSLQLAGTLLLGDRYGSDKTPHSEAPSQTNKRDQHAVVHFGVGRQQQHSTLSAREICLLISHPPLSGLDPEAMGPTWDWSLGMPGSMDGSMEKPMSVTLRVFHSGLT